MNSLIIGITLLITILCAMGMGVALGYGTITAILQVMGHRPEAKPPAALVTEAHGGD